MLAMSEKETRLNSDLAPGLRATRRVDIDANRTISFMGDECRVYSTPNLLLDIESTCRDFLLQHVGPGNDSVGTRVELDHTGATLLGMWAEIEVTVTDVNGPAVSFDFVVRDPLEQVACGHHKRFVVGVEKTAQRLAAKRARLAGN